MRNSNVRKMVVTAILGAVSAVLMMLNFPIPIMPGFLKFDFSELPALVAAFTIGPLSGIGVCLFKNIINVFSSSSNGVGELMNFLVGVALVLPAGLIYRHMPSRKGALIGSLVGSLSMGVVSLPVNYFITYPMYQNFMPMEAIMGMYQTLNPSIETLWQALLVFNAPFTIVRGLIVSAITFAIYKKIAPILTGNKTVTGE